MEKTKQSITVYKRTTQKSLDIIEICRKTFSDLSLYKTNLRQDRENQLESLLIHDTRWLEFVLNGDSNIEQQLNKSFTDLNDWMKIWKEKESKKAKDNDYMLEYCDRYIHCCYVLILAIMMHKRNFRFDQVKNYAKSVYEAYSDRPFAFMITKGKTDFFQNNCWPRQIFELDFEIFSQELNNHLYQFFQNGINQIFLGEIRKYLNLVRVPLAELEQIFSFIFASFDSFRRFINRNYLYSLIEKGLEAQGINYSSLKTMQNQSLEYEIIITKSNFPRYEGMKFQINFRGIPSSPRFIEDHLITFGKDSSEEFTNDISLPNSNDVDSIFAVIFINYRGLNLFDISEQANVKIRIEYGQRIQVKDDLVIVLAKSHQFVINFVKGVIFGDGGESIKLSAFGNCKTTQTINNCEIIMDDVFTIGKSSECNFQILQNDVDDIHAKIYRDRDNKFYIEDNKSKEGTYYKLKTKSQIEKGEPSNFINLKDGQIFQVKFFTFLVNTIKQAD